MKIWIILLSLLGASLTWWQLTRRLRSQKKSVHQQMSLIFKSLAAGVVVYAVLMLVALAWLAVQSAT